MQLKDKSIYEVKTYVQIVGKKKFEVKEFIDATNKETFFQGYAVLGIPTGNPAQPIIPQELEFRYPENVTTLTEAFEQFEDTLNKELEIMAEKMEKARQEQSKKIIMPGDQGSVPFINPNLLKK